VSRAPAILHVQIKFKAATYCHKSSLRWISISLMNCKLTDFSAQTLKLLLFVHLFITKSCKWRGE